MKDLTGMKFNRWTVLRFDERRNKNYYWMCECECGTIKSVNGCHLPRGASKSCGCLNKEIITKHGLDGNKLYHVLNSMKNRCNNPNNNSYANYGGRGIKVCEEWSNNPVEFVKWANDSGYEEGLTIERINVNDGYYPGNCTWVKPERQANNKRSNVMITHDGKTQSLSDWAREVDIHPQTLHYRIQIAKWNTKDALSKPVRR